MIPQSNLHNTRQAWQRALANCISNPEQLLQQLGLQGKLAVMDKQEIRQFPLRVTQHYVDKMRYGDTNDPLLRQVLPLTDEGKLVENFVTDPVGDYAAVTTPGVLQKYHGRALLVTTGACAIHCRYCFRRHFSYSDSNPLSHNLPQTLAQLRADTELDEVILSGGDPLVLSDTRLAKLVAELAQIKHIKRLRIHTRLPIVLPERIDNKLIEWMTHTRLKIIMVIHANHANEIDNEVADAMAQLRQAGCQLLNQSVLLRGINDDVNSLIALSERLNEIDVLPYYLHLLDPVQGASHFDVPEQTATALVDRMRTRVSGYLVPRLVREIQGEPNKTVIS